MLLSGGFILLQMHNPPGFACPEIAHQAQITTRNTRKSGRDARVICTPVVPGRGGSPFVSRSSPAGAVVTRSSRPGESRGLARRLQEAGYLHSQPQITGSKTSFERSESRGRKPRLNEVNHEAVKKINPL